MNVRADVKLRVFNVPRKAVNRVLKNASYDPLKINGQPDVERWVFKSSLKVKGMYHTFILYALFEPRHPNLWIMLLPDDTFFCPSQTPRASCHYLVGSDAFCPAVALNMVHNTSIKFPIHFMCTFMRQSAGYAAMSWWYIFRSVTNSIYLVTALFC